MDEDVEIAAVRRMEAFVGLPLFSEEEQANPHREGLRACYAEAAKLEFSAAAAASEDDSDDDDLEAQIAAIVAWEERCGAVCGDVESAISKISAIGRLRDVARSRAAEVKEACDVLLSEQRRLVLEAESYDEKLRDYEDLDEGLVDAWCEDDVDGLEAALRDADSRERRILESSTFSDDDKFISELRRVRGLWLARVRDALKRLVTTTTTIEETTSAVSRMQALLRKRDPKAADDVQRAYCAARLRASPPEDPVAASAACVQEREAHAALFGIDEADAIDAALFALAEKLHEAGRARVLHATELSDLREISMRCQAQRDDETLDDAVRKAMGDVCRDARERAVFVASAKLREAVEVDPKDLELAHDRRDHLYAPVRIVLLTLSQLHGAVEAAVFDDFAQAAVASCVAAVKPIDHDLFAIKHLLALRERVVPFGIRYGAVVRRRLNWATARGALAEFSKKNETAAEPPKNRLRKLAAFVRQALFLPRVDESTVDARKDLEAELKARCASFVISARDAFSGNLKSSFVERVNSEFPKDFDVRDASPAELSRIKGLDLAQPAALGKLLRDAKAAAETTTIKQDLNKYLDNPNTQALLLKPAKDRALHVLNDVAHLCTAILSPDIRSELDPLFDDFNHLLTT